MAINNKHLATILLGAAAAFAAHKYISMTDEEKQKMSDSLKDKFHKLKDEAEKSADTAKNYFSELKNKAGDLLKEHFPNAEKHFDDFFNPSPKNTTNTDSESAPQTGL